MQTCEGQRYEIENWCRKRGWSIGEWAVEKVSGLSDLDKRTLGKTLGKMQPGDALVCTELSRLGRPKGKTKQQKEFESLLPEILKAKEQGVPYKLLAERVGIHPNTLYRYLKAVNGDK